MSDPEFDESQPKALRESYEFNVELGALRFHIYINDAFFHPPGNQDVLNHNHVTFELHFVHQGTFMLSLENGHYAIPEGSFCVIPPGVYHSQRRSPAGQEVSKTCLSFHYELLPQPKPNYPVDETDHLLRKLKNMSFFTAASSIEAPPLLLSIQRELKARPVGYYAKVQSLFAQILIDVLRSAPDRQTDPRDGALPKILSRHKLAVIEAFFSEYYDRALKESDLAGQLYFSNRQLNRILHELYGMSFRRKLMDTRMKVAMDLLKNTQLTVKAIAARVGYPVVENFHANFKAKTGVTPVAFRNGQAVRTKE